MSCHWCLICSVWGSYCCCSYGRVQRSKNRDVIKSTLPQITKVVLIGLIITLFTLIFLILPFVFITLRNYYKKKKIWTHNNSLASQPATLLFKWMGLLCCLLCWVQNQHSRDKNRVSSKPKVYLRNSKCIQLHCCPGMTLNVCFVSHPNTIYRVRLIAPLPFLYLDMENTGQLNCVHFCVGAFSFVCLFVCFVGNQIPSLPSFTCFTHTSYGP